MVSMINAESVSIVVPMRNASTTVIQTLESIEKQKYPIREIIVIDNDSRDNSVSLVKKFSNNSKIPIRIIVRQSNKGVGASFNLGVKNSKSPLIILMHSDCFLPTDKEIEKLTDPIREDSNIVAAFPTIFLPQNVWKRYNFWQKSLFARAAGKGTAGLTTKFDCIRKDSYQNIGGFDVENFGVGAEDADLHERLRKIGRVVKSNAMVIHLHYLGEDYTLRKMLLKQKIYAKAYGRAIRMRGVSLFQNGIFLLVKPSLAILPFMPYLHSVGMILLIIYSFLYTKKMFTTKSALQNPRIIILPFLNIFSLYYETFWTIESFLFGKNNVE